MSTDLDLVSLGEVMLRLDPGEGRIRTASAFDVHVGGGEFNVAAGLANCFGLRTAVVTALPQTATGELAAGLIRRSGVADDLIRWVPDGGTGAQARVGINFTERGFGVRSALGISDRAGSAAARMRPGDVDWAALFDGGRVRRLHTGGVFTALSPQTALLAAEAVEAARAAGVLVSYDVNFRASLFDQVPDRAAHAAAVERILQNVDVLFSGEPEYLLSLGERPSDDGVSGIEQFERLVASARQRFPGIRVFAATLRTAGSASSNDWGAVAWSAAEGVVASATRPGLEVLDRIGGGDGFAAGVLYGLMTGSTLQRAVDLGAAHGALVMTTAGDVSAATLAEVEELTAGTARHVRR